MEADAHRPAGPGDDGSRVISDRSAGSSTADSAPRIWPSSDAPSFADVLPPEPDQAPRADEGEVSPPVEPTVRRNRIVGWATDLGPPTTLVLLRHGVTDHTLGRLFSGLGGADPELSDLGQAQARDAARAVSERGDVTAVVSSPLRRCRETAAASAAALGVDVEIDEGLAEAGFGAWDGRTLEDVTAAWPTELEAWLASTSAAPPGGESLDAVAVRVRAARDRVLRRHPGETVLVATHVNPIKIMVALALGAPSSALHHMVLGPASLSELRYYGDGTEVLAAFSVVAHLGAGRDDR